MVNAMRFHVVIEPADEGGYTAQCVEIPGAISEGETREATLENIRDAIRAVLHVRRTEAQAQVNAHAHQSHEMETVDVDA